MVHTKMYPALSTVRTYAPSAAVGIIPCLHHREHGFTCICTEYKYVYVVLVLVLVHTVTSYK